MSPASLGKAKCYGCGTLIRKGTSGFPPLCNRCFIQEALRQKASASQRSLAHYGDTIE